MPQSPDRCVFVTPPMLVNDHAALFEPLAACGLTVVHNRDVYPMGPEMLAACLEGATAAIVGLDALTAAVFERCPRLQIVARNGVGLDTVDVDAATRHGVFVTVPHGANSTSVAELAMGLLITLARRVIPNHNRVQAGVWQREQGVELAGKTLGIIGLGRIGKKVARRALAFEMNVIAHDIAPDGEFAQEHGIRFVERGELLATADIVSLHVPLTNLTFHLMDPAAFATMKRGAYLVNTARGPVVDPAALAAALDRGQLAGAALDVHTHEGRIEPALLHRANVVTTTHLGAYTHEALASTTRAAVHSLVQFFTGLPVDGLINSEAAVVAAPVTPAYRPASLD